MMSETEGVHLNSRMVQIWNSGVRPVLDHHAGDRRAPVRVAFVTQRTNLESVGRAGRQAVDFGRRFGFDCRRGRPYGGRCAAAAHLTVLYDVAPSALDGV